jgi:hypothetical protein
VIDLRTDIAGLYRRLSAQSGGSAGRLTLFISAQPGEGTSSVAAAFALLAAEGARKPVWLLDLDLRGNHTFADFAVGPMSASFGGVGPPYSALLRTEPFFSLEPPARSGERDPGLFTVHRVGDSHMMVTHFDAARLEPGQGLRIRQQPSYWAAVREATDWTVIDAPALARANAGLAIAGQADQVVLVVRADLTGPAEIDDLRAQVEGQGGRIAGVVFNRVRGDARLVDRWSL